MSKSAAASLNPGWRFYLAFLSLTAITLMVALDAMSLPVALPLMADILNGSALEAFWSGTSFLLASTIFQMVFGSFSEVFGRKPVLLLSLTLFGIGAIIAAIANTFTVVIVGRCIQGIGGGGTVTVTDIVLTDLVPLRLRGQYLAFINCAWAIGMIPQIVNFKLVMLTTPRSRYWSSARWWICAECFLEMDILDQSAVHWSRRNTYCSLFRSPS